MVDKHTNTILLIKELTRRLATRDTCRKDTYKLKINGDEIIFYPNVSVFPDKHRRKESDRDTVLHCVLRNHFKLETHSKLTSDGNVIEVTCNDKFFESGNWEYQFSYNRKSRKWIKVQ